MAVFLSPLMAALLGVPEPEVPVLQAGGDAHGWPTKKPPILHTSEVERFFFYKVATQNQFSSRVN